MNNLAKIQICHILVISISLIICAEFMKITFAQNTSDCSNILSYKLPNCPPGYTLTNGLCFLVSHVPTTSCPTGYQLYNNSFCYPLSSLPCVPYIAPLTITRPSYAVENEIQPRCPPGSIFLQNQCRKLVCSQGEYHKGRCLQAACANGKVWRGRRCQDPEYVTTIIEIENVFTDSKQEKLDNLDMQIITSPPHTETNHIKTYFNKTVINQGTTNIDKNLDIEVQTNVPIAKNLDNIDVQIINGAVETEPTNIIIYFNKTVVNRDTTNVHKNLDIEVQRNSAADNLLAKEKTDVGNDNLDVVINTKTPYSNMNSVPHKTNIFFNKTDLSAITSNSSALKDNLDVQILVSEPFQADANNTLFFNKTIIADTINKANVSNILDNTEITTTTNKFDKPHASETTVISTTTVNAATTTYKTNIINSTVVLTTPTTAINTTVANGNNNCCSVYTPRICKKYGVRWSCFNRSYKICDVRVCTHDVIYLKSPEIAYKAPLLIMPPNPPLSACANSACDNKKIPNCAGCISYEAETCSFYCYRYLCAQDSCSYIDQQFFCTFYAGEFGCRERDGCIWNWCEHS